jgi:hypothetical protein
LEGSSYPPYWQQQPYYYGQQPPPRPPIDSRLLRPRAGWYAAAAVPLVLGLAAMALFIVLAVRTFPDEPRPFLAPGDTQLRLAKGKDQTIYRHTRGSGYLSSHDAPSCTVRRIPGGRGVRLGNAGSTTLSYGEDEYVTELHFEPPANGHYLIRCEAPPARHVPLAVGNRPRLAVFGATIVAAIASAGLGVLLAIGVAVLVAVLRSRHKRRLQDEVMASTSAPGGPAPGR